MEKVAGFGQRDRRLRVGTFDGSRAWRNAATQSDSRRRRGGGLEQHLVDQAQIPPMAATRLSTPLIVEDVFR
jgi:hypothetical protein